MPVLLAFGDCPEHGHLPLSVSVVNDVVFAVCPSCVDRRLASWYWMTVEQAEEAGWAFRAVPGSRANQTVRLGS